MSLADLSDALANLVLVSRQPRQLLVATTSNDLGKVVKIKGGSPALAERPVRREVPLLI